MDVDGNHPDRDTRVDASERWVLECAFCGWTRTSLERPRTARCPRCELWHVTATRESRDRAVRREDA